MTRLYASVTPATWLPAVAQAARGFLRNITDLIVAIEHRSEVKHLAELDDRVLKDIGLVRSDVEGALAEPLFRDPSRVLVRSDRRHSRGESGAISSRQNIRPVVPTVKAGWC